MLYGGPLGTYLSGYHASGSAKSRSPSFTSTGSGSSSSVGLNSSRSTRYRAPSAYGTPISGTNPSSSLSTPSSGRTGFYTPQARRKYSDDGTELSSNNRSRYTTTTGNPVNSSNSGSGTGNNSIITATSGYYSRPSPVYMSASSTAIGSSTATANASEAPIPSSLRAATLSQYPPKFRRAHSQATSRWLQEGTNYPSHGPPNELVDSSFLDYKRLYEAEHQDTIELRAQIDQAQQELRELRARVEDARRLPSHQHQHQHQQQQKPQPAGNANQRILEELRASSEKLKAEHRALTRVISRLM